MDYSPIGDSISTSSEVKRRTRTSAAMVGLALSMGATGLLMPRQGDGAQAAEPQAPETSSSVSQVTAVPVQELQPVSLPAVEAVEHTVRRGQTLQKIANLYRISVAALAEANDLPVTATVRLGQVLKVPVSAAEAAAATAPQLVASADLERLPVAVQETQDIENKTERDRALSRLEQQRIKLKNSLAELRRGESNSLIAVAPGSVQSESVQAQPVPSATGALPGVNMPSLAILPSPSSSPAAQVEPDWMRVGQSLDMTESARPAGAAPAVQPPAQPSVVAARPTAILPESSATTSYQVNLGDTIAEIARNHNVRQSDLIAANRLSNPNVIFVGQVLRLPEAQPGSTGAAVNPSVPSVLPKSNPVESVAPANAVTSGSSQFVQNPQAVAVAPTTILPGLPTVNSPVIDPAVVPAAPSTVQSGQNSYVQGLVSEVRALRERHLQQGPTQSSTVVAAANVDAASLTSGNSLAPATLDNEVVDIPEAVRVPARRLAPAARTTTPAPQPAPAVVAAAPLGSESYAPLLEPVTGRMVSPALPSLPDADKFLPEGALNGYIWPARGMLSSGYGWRWGRMHQGIDIAADIGTPIYAAASGVIEYAGWNSGGYGNMVEIRHADGSMTRYAHMNAVYVQVGQRVSQSEQIGEMGSTGYSTGPHLHFEVHLADQGTVNPMAYLPSR